MKTKTNFGNTITILQPPIVPDKKYSREEVITFIQNALLDNPTTVDKWDKFLKRENLYIK